MKGRWDVLVDAEVVDEMKAEQEKLLGLGFETTLAVYGLGMARDE